MSNRNLSVVAAVLSVAIATAVFSDPQPAAVASRAEPPKLPPEINELTQAARVANLKESLLSTNKRLLEALESAKLTNTIAESPVQTGMVTVDQFDRQVRPGEGVDLINVHDVQSYAWRLPPEASRPTTRPDDPVVGDSEAFVRYVSTASEAASSVGEGEGFAAKFRYKGFSIGPSFSSSSLRGRTQRETAGYFVVSWASSTPWRAAQSVGEAANLGKPATDLLGFDPERASPAARVSFLKSFGTHFVSEFKADTRYDAIYSFKAASADSISQFNSKAKVSFGFAGVFDASFGSNLSRALEESQGMVSAEFTEHVSSDRDLLPLPSAPASQPSGFLNFDQLRDRYNQYLDVLRGRPNRNYTRFRLQSYAKALWPRAAAGLPEAELKTALATLSALQSVNSDIQTVLGDEKVFTHPPDSWDVDDLTIATTNLRESIFQVYAAPTTENISAMRDAATQATTIAARLFNASDFLPAPVRVQVAHANGTPGVDAATEPFIVRVLVDPRLPTPRGRIVGVPTTGPVMLTFNEPPTSSTPGPATQPRVVRSQAVQLTLPTPNVPILLQLADDAGRARECGLIQYISTTQATFMVPPMSGVPDQESWQELGD